MSSDTGKFISIQEAADLVGVPRHYMNKKVDAGDVPVVEADGERLVLLADVLAWNEQERARRWLAMKELGQAIEEEYRDGLEE